MHALQPKHSKLKPDEVRNLLERYNISVSQLPKIKLDDAAIANLGTSIGDVIKIDRVEDGKVNEYYRVVA